MRPIKQKSIKQSKALIAKILSNLIQNKLAITAELMKISPPMVGVWHLVL